MSLSSLTLSSKLFKFTALALALTLAGCGGGDGTDTLPPRPDLGVSQPSDNGSTDGTVSAVNVSPITLTDSSGSMVRIVTSIGATASVKVVNANGESISGALVKFETDAAITSILFGNTNGTVLTNADGIAVMNIKAVGTLDSGSYALTATASYNDVSTKTPAYFYSVQSANLIFDDIKVEKNRLSYGGTTDVTGLVKNSGTMQVQNGVNVDFAASCGSISSAMTNVLGFRATYDAGTCEGNQTIVATIAESGATIRLPITIDKRTELGALSLKCISGDTPSFPDSSADGTGADGCANQVSLGVLGSTLPSVRSVEFIVSRDDKPFSNERVKVELLSAPNDFGIGSTRNQQPLNLSTDNAGRIKVPLYAGNTIENSIRLRATLVSRVDVTATFENISVISSIPSQAGFSVLTNKNVLAATETTISGVRRLNDSTTLNVIARDRQNEFVNGSIINFIAEGGTLSANSCVVSNGRCQVILSTVGVLPEDRRATVLAYTSTGEKVVGGFQTFLDENENGKVDQNEIKINSTDRLVYKQFIVGFADTTPTFNPTIDSPSLQANEKGTSQRSFNMFGSSEIGDKAISMPSGTKIQVQSIDKTAANGYSCFAQLVNNGMISNILTVPNLVDLYLPETPSVSIVKQDNTDKSYVLRTQNCGAGDEVRLSITTPSPNSKTTTTTIPVI